MKWSEFLITKSLDNFLFDSERSDTAEDRALLAELRRMCAREFTSLQSVKELKSELKAFAKSRAISDRVSHVLEGVGEQLEEISDDLRFARSSQGRFILFVQDWGQRAYETVRAQQRFADAFIGAHRDRKEIVVTGHVPDEAALEDLRSIIDAHPPGVEVTWKVEVRPQNVTSLFTHGKACGRR